jgi:hypothetical protein
MVSTGIFVKCLDKDYSSDMAVKLVTILGGAYWLAVALDGAEVTTTETVNTRRSRKRRVESSSRSLSSGFDETGVPNTNLMRRIWSSTVASRFGKDHL